MGFPSNSELKKARSKLKRTEGTQTLAPDTSSLEKFRWDICQKFIQYKQKLDLTQEEFVKASSNISSSHLRGLKALREEHKCEFNIVVCSEKTKRFIDGISIYPWSVFLEELWAGKFF